MESDDDCDNLTFADVDNILTESGSDDDTSEVYHSTMLCCTHNLVASSDTQNANDDNAYKK
jgi:hypothetical protein